MYNLVALPSHNLKSAKVFAAPTMQHSTTRGLQNTKRDLYWPAKEIHFQATHSMPPEKIEIFKSMESWAEKNLLKHLKPVEKSWQPQDFLPRADSEGFYEQTMLNTLDGVRDETGVSLSPWAVWNRGWTAEENRHGDLLNKYLYLSGRVDMRQIEKTTQYLIGCGMDFKFENNPYNCFIYTSFQERATFISHGNTARLARRYGDNKLAHICTTIAADEKRHEMAYTMIVEKLFEIDPDTTVLALADMMRKKIVMPALLIYDGQDDNLFQNFSAAAQNLGVYTAKDYAENIEFFVGRWNVEGLTGLSSEGRRAQDFVCRLPSRIRRLEERAQEKANKAPTIRFSWIRYREVLV
ncbi:hypothetical protein SADUNF_Sadunf10G0136200 [Salix dunnii]|uniref:Acyl-[acyl-carrier-protein] desaturase n=1 Tax=Salix dunnii TaxID=1413687 RepID=A0A835MR23_9ROSI|nr:hypothetical protein SADUNF_Sadunf10G0136200 [Salix dunnii]